MSKHSKYPALIGTSSATDRLREIQRELRRNRIQPGYGTRLRVGPAGTTIEADPKIAPRRGGEAVWL